MNDRMWIKSSLGRSLRWWWWIWWWWWWCGCCCCCGCWSWWLTTIVSDMGEVDGDGVIFCSSVWWVWWWLWYGGWLIWCAVLCVCFGFAFRFCEIWSLKRTITGNCCKFTVLDSNQHSHHQQNLRAIAGLSTLRSPIFLTMSTLFTMIKPTVTKSTQWQLRDTNESLCHVCNWFDFRGNVQPHGLVQWESESIPPIFASSIVDWMCHANDRSHGMEWQFYIFYHPSSTYHLMSHDTYTQMHIVNYCWKCGPSSLLTLTWRRQSFNVHESDEDETLDLSQWIWSSHMPIQRSHFDIDPYHFHTNSLPRANCWIVVQNAKALMIWLHNSNDMIAKVSNVNGTLYSCTNSNTCRSCSFCTGRISFITCIATSPTPATVWIIPAYFSNDWISIIWDERGVHWWPIRHYHRIQVYHIDRQHLFIQRRFIVIWTFWFANNAVNPPWCDWRATLVTCWLPISSIPMFPLFATPSILPTQWSNRSYWNTIPSRSTGWPPHRSVDCPVRPIWSSIITVLYFIVWHIIKYTNSYKLIRHLIVYIIYLIILYMQLYHIYVFVRIIYYIVYHICYWYNKLVIVRRLHSCRQLQFSNPIIVTPYRITVYSLVWLGDKVVVLDNL